MRRQLTRRTVPSHAGTKRARGDAVSIRGSAGHADAARKGAVMTAQTGRAAAGRPGARTSARGPARAAAAEQPSHADRVARGKDARAVAPLDSHAEFSPGP